MSRVHNMGMCVCAYGAAYKAKRKEARVTVASECSFSRLLVNVKVIYYKTSTFTFMFMLVHVNVLLAWLCNVQLDWLSVWLYVWRCRHSCCCRCIAAFIKFIIYGWLVGLLVVVVAAVIVTIVVVFCSLVFLENKLETKHFVQQ